jgi:endonuclease/exonuclease/phosphatase family metal-dependent hydrolase
MSPVKLDVIFTWVVLLALATVLTLPSSAQISMGSNSYSQNFDSLSNVVGTSIPWTNNQTLPGWYASKSVGPNDVTNYNAGTGSSTAGSLYSFGSAGSSERALGSLASGTPGDFAYGVRFTNDSGSARSNILVSYTGEQWRAGNASTQSLAFYYRIGSALTNADATDTQPWISLAALNFYSPNTNSPQALNGNQTTNRVSFTNVVLGGVVVPAGQELFLRWFDPDDSGFDDGLGIDDLTVTFGDAVTNEPPQPGTNTAFSVLTYNCHGNSVTNWSTNSPQVQAIARQMQYLQPDIITFQEIPFPLRYEMTNFVTAFLPGYSLALSNGTDGFITSAILSRYPITRFSKWLDSADLEPFGYTNADFTRDLFEAEIAVPGISQPLHVFTTHLKSGTTTSDDSARRGAEASAISNFLVTTFLPANSLHPYILTGDFNEDIDHPATGSKQPIQRLTTATGLQLTTPLNPISLENLTHSIQGALDRRYDYILPNSLLFSNIQSSQVFRTDLLNPVPPNLNSNDDIVASDHLPVMMVFNNPFTAPFLLTSITRSNTTTSLTWQTVPGQSYRVEISSNLVSWATLVDTTSATSYAITFTTNLPAAPQFFRVKRLN